MEDGTVRVVIIDGNGLEKEVINGYKWGEAARFDFDLSTKTKSNLSYNGLQVLDRDSRGQKLERVIP